MSIERYKDVKSRQMPVKYCDLSYIQGQADLIKIIKAEVKSIMDNQNKEDTALDLYRLLTGLKPTITK
jgi:hypothetical protein